MTARLSRVRIPLPPQFLDKVGKIYQTVLGMKFSALLLSLLFFFLSFIFLTSESFAQTQNSQPSLPVQNNYAAPNTEEGVPHNLHTYSQNVVIEVMAAVACQLTGVDPTTPDHRCLGTNPKTGKIGYVDNDGGAIGFMSDMIAVLYTPPAHTGEYVRHLAQNFGITKTAHAKLMEDDEFYQGGKNKTPDTRFGTGFASISPLLNIWTAFRNIAYLLFVLVFVVVGVAIMLRIKIDPRTVMTIQNQIPKIIIGILLVTFSFAIAGFLIDVMWVAIYLFYGVFHGIPGVDVTSLAPQNIAGVTPLGAIGLSGGLDIAKNGAEVISGIVTGLFNNAIGAIFGKIFGGIIGGATSTGGLLGAGIGAVAGTFIPVPGIGTLTGAAIGATVGGIIGPMVGLGGGGGAIGALGGVIAFLIIAIALLFALIKVWFALLGAYISILINIVFAPFWVIGSLVPGSKISFSGWIRSMLGNLAAFPATLVMFLLGKTFMDTIATSPSGQFVPPFIGNIAETKQFGALIGLGIVLSIPNVVKMMRSTFGAPALDLGGVGAAVGVGAGIAGLPQRMLSMGYQLHMAKEGFGGLKSWVQARRSGKSKDEPAAKPIEPPIGSVGH